MMFVIIIIVMDGKLIDFSRNANFKQSFAVCSEVVNPRQTFVFSATLTFVPTKPQRLEFAKKKKKKFHQITTKEKLGYFYYLLDFMLQVGISVYFFYILVSGFWLPDGL